MKVGPLVLSGIIVGVLMAAYAVYRQSAAPRKQGPMLADLEVGERLCLPARWSNHAKSRAIVIVTSSTCPACAANEPFERKLAARCAALSIPVVHVLAERREQNRRADHLRREGRLVVRADLGKLRMRRVPAAVAIDQQGVILAMRTGSVPPQGADAVVEEITAKTTGPRYAGITSRDLAAAIRREQSDQVLCLTRPADPSAGGLRRKVIALPDLAIRARYELDKRAAVFVDCSTGSIPPWFCQEALLTLHQTGFKRLVAVDLHSSGASGYCAP